MPASALFSPLRLPTGRCRPSQAALLLRAVALAVLGGFHLQLLLGRIQDGSLANPTVALKWLAAISVIWALLRLRKQSHRHFQGRSRATLWAAVLLLHLVGPKAQLEARWSLPEWIVPVSAAAVLGAFGFFAQALAKTVPWPQLSAESIAPSWSHRPHPHLLQPAFGPRAPPNLFRS